MNEKFSLFCKKADGHVFTYTLLYIENEKNSYLCLLFVTK